MEVEAKTYKADYGKAEGQEIKITAVEENTAAGKAKTPDIKAQGHEFFADHAHWHLGDTEHRINGEKRNLKGELHIVHKSPSGKALVMGAYIEVDDKTPANPLIDAILKGGDENAHSYLDFIGKDKWAAGKYHTYHGTLTTEPYSGGVTFYLLNSDTVKLTSQQYEQLKAHIQMAEKDNSRTTQAYGDRAIVEATARAEPQKAI
jgi:carbonic anhydrase